jgi:hypothetical protein
VEEAVPGKMEASMDAQNEEKFAAAESETGDMHDAVPARATRARRQRTVVSVAEDEAPKARWTSRRTVTIQEDEEQQQGKNCLIQVNLLLNFLPSMLIFFAA